jgi:hypothetical protein
MRPHSIARSTLQRVTQPWSGTSPTSLRRAPSLGQNWPPWEKLFDDYAVASVSGFRDHELPIAGDPPRVVDD